MPYFSSNCLAHALVAFSVVAAYRLTSPSSLAFFTSASSPPAAAAFLGRFSVFSPPEAPHPASSRAPTSTGPASKSLNLMLIILQVLDRVCLRRPPATLGKH